MQFLYVGSDFCSTKTLTSVFPKYLLEEGANVDVIVPRFHGINEGDSPLALRLIDAQCRVDNRDEHIRIYEGRRDAHIKTFYLESERLSVRPAFTSNDAVIAANIFAHAVCQLITKISTKYDVVFCDGMSTAFVPVLAKTAYAQNSKINSLKIVQGLAGIEDKASIDMKFIDRLGLSGELASSEAMEFYGKLSMLKGIYIYADKIIFPSEDVEKLINNNRGKDIGMEGVLFSRTEKLAHVTVGIDKQGLKAFDIAQKPEIKTAFCKSHKLSSDPKRPLVVFVGRLDNTSGIDLINDILDDLMDRKVNLVICGEGNDTYVEAVKSWTSEFRGSVLFLNQKANCQIIRDLFGAADVLLFAPKFESIDMLPLKARHFGAVPVARNIGAARVSLHAVKNIKKLDPADNAFSFMHFDSDEFFDAAMDALDLFTARDAFKQLQTQTANDVPCLCSTAKQLINILNNLIG